MVISKKFITKILLMSCFMIIPNKSCAFEEESLYEGDIVDIYDPLEPYNRVMFKINDLLDRSLIVPIASSYKYFVPNFIQNSIKNITYNFFAPIRLINFVCQGEGEKATKTFLGFFMNIFFGFFGAFDVASKCKLSTNDTSFSKTLKKWGAKPGPYIVLPIVGSTSLRGLVGKISDSFMSPSTELMFLHYKKRTRRSIYYTMYTMDLFVSRVELLGLMNDINKTSIDKYAAIRNAVMSNEQ